MKCEKVAIVKTGWGHKEAVTNIKEYCAIIANLNKDKVSSVHYHHNKLETYYVMEGKMAVYYTENISKFKNIVEEGGLTKDS